MADAEIKDPRNKLQTMEQMANIYDRTRDHVNAASLYLRIGAGYEKRGEKARAERFYSKAFSRAGSAAAALADAGKHIEAAGMYASFAEKFDNMERKVEAGTLFWEASIQAEKGGNNIDAGRYAGLSGRRFQQASVDKDRYSPAKRSGYARRSGEGYDRVNAIAEVTGQITAGIKETADKMRELAKRLEAEKEEEPSGKERTEAEETVEETVAEMRKRSGKKKEK